MTINCPGCDKKREHISTGSYKCHSCGAKFKITYSGVEIIKLYKNNYWSIFDVTISPFVFLFLLLSYRSSTVYIKYYGLVLLFSPILIALKSITLSGDYTILKFYKLFFTKKVGIMDTASQFSIYFLITTNLLGLLLFLLF